MKPKFPTNYVAKHSGEIELQNLKMVEATAEAGSAAATMGFVPDQWKAFMEFDICHTLPAVLGPVQAGNYIAFQPETIAASYASLCFQQLNLRHAIRQYSVDAGNEDVSRDRIVGCIVMTGVPRKPMNGYGTSQICIHATAVVFKLAEGVDRIIGQHLTGRKKQSVSIEVITPPPNIGILRPSTGELHPILNLPEHFEAALSDVGEGFPHVGKIEGEQLLVIYGLNGNPVSLRGVGMTDNPAELAAKITSITAEAKAGSKKEIGDMDYFAVAAERVDQVLIGQRIHFPKHHTIGVVRKVWREGEAKLKDHLWSKKATPADPVVELRMLDGKGVLKHYSELPQGK